MSNKRLSLTVLADTPPWEWPEDAGEAILAVLEDAAAPTTDRILAARLGGELVVMDDDIALALLAILRDSDAADELRIRAALSMGPVLELADTDGFDPPESVPIREETYETLRAALQSTCREASVGGEVRRRVLEAAVRAPQDWHVGAVRSAWSSGDRGWRQTAVFCMGYVPGFDAPILAALQDADSELRYEAVVAAGRRELPAAWPHVSAILRAGKADKPLLLAAIEAAAAIRPQEAPALLARYVRSKDDDIAEAAGDAVAMADVLAELDGDFDDD